MRPIDFKSYVSESQIVSKVQQVKNNKNEYFVQNQAIDQNKKFEKELKKVNTTDKTYDVKINIKQEGKKNNFHHNKKSRQQKNNEEKTSEDKPFYCKNIGAKIDIKI